MRFFTVELSERYEEIHLLYSISETLGSILHMDDAARVILREVCDVMGAKRGSLWLYRDEDESLHLTAAVGGEGLDGPIPVDDPDAVTSMVFREQRAVIASRAPSREERERGRSGRLLPVGADPLHATLGRVAHARRHEPHRPARRRALQRRRPEAALGDRVAGGVGAGEQAAARGERLQGADGPRDGAGPRPAAEAPPGGGALLGRRGGRARVSGGAGGRGLLPALQALRRTRGGDAGRRLPARLSLGAHHDADDERRRDLRS